MAEELLPVSRVHDDLGQWDYEYLNWQTKLEHWQRERHSARSLLGFLQELVRQYGEAVQPCRSDRPPPITTAGFRSSTIGLRDAGW